MFKPDENLAASTPNAHGRAPVFHTPKESADTENTTPEKKYGVYSLLEAEREQERRARMICECGDYFNAIGELHDQKIFDKQCRRIKKEYGARLAGESWITDTVWEMITVLELYDPGTWEHSLRVFETVRENLRNNRHIGIFLRQKLSEEDITEEQLLLAALLHDVGKIGLPKSVLFDKTRAIEWHSLAWIHLPPDDYRDLREKLDRSRNLRIKDILPYSLNSNKEGIADLQRQGNDPNQPLGVIVNIHQDISALILETNGYTIPAEIARHHHSRIPIDGESRPIALSSLRASNILHLFDTLDAITDPNRSYREPGSFLDALSILAQEALNGFIDQSFAAILINDYLHNQNDRYPQLHQELLDEHYQKQAAPIRELLAKNNLFA